MTAPVPEEIAALSERVRERILASARNADGPADPDWSVLADEVVRAQVRHITPYGRWCRSQGFDGSDDRPLVEVPATPTAAFKELVLFAGDTGSARVFRTSGTTQGARRGESRFSPEGLALMDAAIDVNARRMLFPDDDRPQLLALAPSPDADPERIMSYGLARLMRVFGRDDSTFLVGPEGLDMGRALSLLSRAADQNTPVMLVGATFALPALVAAVEGTGGPIALPAGSAVMDAGGMKAAGAAIEPAALRERVAEALGVPAGRQVNLLGMTELASQIYDDVIAARAEGRTPRRRKLPPPWMRTWAMDPVSLAPLPSGEIGVLRHLDLANVERPALVQTDDLGRTHDDGTFEILGRASDAEARGCAIDAADWVATGSA